MQVTKQVNVDLLNLAIPPVVNAKQNDKGTRFIQFNFFNGVIPFEIGADILAAFRYKKPDGTSGFYDKNEDGKAAITIEGNRATVQLVEQVLTIAGIVDAELNFYKSTGEKLTTYCIKIDVEQSAFSDKSIISSDYGNILTEQMTKVLKAEELIKQQMAEAANSAAAALANKNAAAASATQSANSAAAANQKSTEAANSAAAALASKNAAAASATQSANSAAAANQKSTEAANSAAAALASKNAASASATQSANSAATANQKSTEAASSAAAALISKNAAEAAAGKAGGTKSVNGKTPNANGEVSLNANDIGALPINGTAVDALKLGNQLPTYYQPKADNTLATENKTVVGAINEVRYSIPNPNLLDNTDFAHPINQRNVSGTITAAGYFIDRWKLVSGSVTLTANGLQLNGTMSQILEFAAGTSTAARVGMYSGTANASYNNNDKTFAITSSGGVIEWAKLEKGSAATPYFPKGYGAEINECKRFVQYVYYAMGGSTTAVGITFNPPMRITPTISYSPVSATIAPDILYITYNGGVLTIPGGGHYSNGSVVAVADY